MTFDISFVIMILRCDTTNEKKKKKKKTYVLLDYEMRDKYWSN